MLKMIEKKILKKQMIKVMNKKQEKDKKLNIQS